MKDDVYIGDGLHYVLGVELLVLSVCGYDKNGADLWEFHKPLKNIREKIIIHTVLSEKAVKRLALTGLS